MELHEAPGALRQLSSSSPRGGRCPPIRAAWSPPPGPERRTAEVELPPCGDRCLRLGHLGAGPLRRPEDGVGLAAAGLAVGEHARVHPIEGRHDRVLRHTLVHFLLLHLLIAHLREEKGAHAAAGDEHDDLGRLDEEQPRAVGLLGRLLLLLGLLLLLLLLLLGVLALLGLLLRLLERVEVLLGQLDVSLAASEAAAAACAACGLLLDVALPGAAGAAIRPGPDRVAAAPPAAPGANRRQVALLLERLLQLLLR